MYANTGDYSLFYQVFRAVYGPSYQTMSPLQSLRQKIADRQCCYHGQLVQTNLRLFLMPTRVQDRTINSIPLQLVRQKLDKPPTLKEAITVIKLLKSDNATRVDNFPQRCALPFMLNFTSSVVESMYTIL